MADYRAFLSVVGLVGKMNKSFRDYFREWETTDAERQANNRVPIYILGGFALLILVVNACLLSC